MKRSLAALVLAILAMALSSCGAGACGCSSFGPTPSPEPSQLPQSRIEGVVIAVDAASLTDIRGFTLRTSLGATIDFKVGQLENVTEFSPSHLKEHQATSSPIRVWFRVENGERVAYRLEDAP